MSPRLARQRSAGPCKNRRKVALKDENAEGDCIAALNELNKKALATNLVGERFLLSTL